MNNKLSLDKFRYHDDTKVFKVKKPKKNDTVVYKDLPPSIDKDILIVFVGFNPGLQSSLQQHHYAHFTNLFWKLFNQSNLLIHILSKRQISWNSDEFLKKLITKVGDNYITHVKAEHDYDLLPYGIGFTDLVLRCTKTAQELTKQEKLNNVPRLIQEFSLNQPKFIVIIGKGIWESIVEWISHDLQVNFKLKKSFKWGLQILSDEYGEILSRWHELLGYEFNQYVFPSTSGLVTSLTKDEKSKIWFELLNDVLN